MAAAIIPDYIAVTPGGIKTMPSGIADITYVLGPPGAHGDVQLVRNEMSATEVVDVRVLSGQVGLELTSGGAPSQIPDTPDPVVVPGSTA